MHVPKAFSFPHFDKLAHFFIYGLLATAIVRLPLLSKKTSNWLCTIGLVSLYGLFDEYRQSFTPSRFVESADWLANFSGALIATTLYAYCPRYALILEYPLVRSIKHTLTLWKQSFLKLLLQK
jgi:VanZ family protein